MNNVVNNSGNCYLVGTFTTTGSDFNMAVGTDLKSVAGGVDTFVTRINADGSYAWTQTFGGTGDDHGGGIVLNGAGTVVYVSGHFNSTDARIGVSGPTIAAVSGSDDAYVIALDAASGNAVPTFGTNGVQTFGGTNTDTGDDVVVLGSKLYMAGTFNSTDAGFGGFTGGFAISGGTTDAYVMCMDATTGTPNGIFAGSGVQTFGAMTGTVTSNGVSMSTANGNIYIGGSLTGNGFGIGGSGTLNFIGGSSDCFIAAMDGTSGNAVAGFGTGGAQVFGGSSGGSGSQDVVNSLVSASGFLYATGYFDSTDFGIASAGTVSPSGSFDAFVVALDAATGQGKAGFANNGIQKIGGTSGSQAGNSITASGGVLYVTGDFDSMNLGIGGTSAGESVIGSGSAWIAAIDLTTGTAVNTFGGDGIVRYGGSANDFGESAEVVGNAVFWCGGSNSSDSGIDGLGSNDSSGGIGGFLQLLDRTTGAATTFQPSFMSASATPNPGRSGAPVTFSVNGTGTFNWDFGDGASTSGNPVTHTYTVSSDTAFTVMLTGTVNQNFAFTVLAPNAGAGGTLNVGNGRTITNPVANFSVSETGSDGGVIELTLDGSNIGRATTSFSTDFDDIPGRSSKVSGSKAVHKYIQNGIYVATSHAADGDTGVETAKVRKTLAISARETGASDALPLPSDTTVTLKSLKGKFLFTKSTPDSVTFTGTIVLPAGLQPSRPDGNSLAIGIGNVVDTVTVDAKGKGKVPSTLGRIKKIQVKYPRLAKGVSVTAGGEKAQITAQYSIADLETLGFDTEGITAGLRADEAGAKSVPRSIQLAIVLAGVSYEASAPVDYKVSKKADAGTIAGRSSTR